MSRERPWLFGALLLALVGAVLYRRTVFPSQPPAETTRVTFITGGDNSFWQLTVRGAEAAAKKYDAHLTVQMPKQREGLNDQSTMLLELDPSKIDGLAISPLDADAQTRMINKLSEKTNVVTFDADAPLSQRRVCIGTSNYLAGRMAADLVAEVLPEGGKVAVLIANLAKSNTIERKQGFEEAKSDSLEIVDFLVDQGDREAAERNAKRVLEDHPDIAAIVGLNSYHGPAILAVLKEADKLDKVKVVAFDENEDTLNGIAEGHIHASVVQDPFLYGYEAVRFLATLKNSDQLELPIVGYGNLNIPCEIVRQKDVDGFRERLAKRLASNEPEKKASAN